jgi:putative ABC transport system ATP-binding protein
MKKVLKGAKKMSFVEIKNVKKHYGEGEAKQTVLKGVDLSIEKGELCVLLGPSGSGKSTLLNIIGGIDDADEGYVMIDNEKTKDMNEKRLTQYRRKHLGYVFQLYNLVANLTIEENILLPIELSGRKTKDYKKQLNELLEITGLTSKRKSYPSQLSGGQQQRCSIARAVLTEPEILLADEPTGNLDRQSGEEIMKLFKRLNEEKGITILQVTHSDECAAYGNRIVKLSDHILEDVV